MPLRKTYATKESAFEKLRNRKRCVHSIAGEPGLFATVIGGIASTDLDTSVGVSGPHDFAVRLRYLRLGTVRVHRILPRVRDDRVSPL
jgi:hypothetical protein